MLHRVLAPIVVVAIAGLLGGSLGSVRRPTADAELSFARVDRTTWNFGRVRAGTPLAAICTIRNEGGRRLIVQPRDDNCGCVVADTSPLIVQPGSSGDLLATVETHELQGPMQIALEYSTNDPQLPTISLVLRADVHGR